LETGARHEELRVKSHRAAELTAGAVAVGLPFHRFLHRLRGSAFALACISLHLLHHLCNGVSAGARWRTGGETNHLTRSRGASRRASPRLCVSA
jgi:hypothetical protein